MAPGSQASDAQAVTDQQRERGEIGNVVAGDKRQVTGKEECAAQHVNCQEVCALLCAQPLLANMKHKTAVPSLHMHCSVQAEHLVCCCPWHDRLCRLV